MESLFEEVMLLNKQKLEHSSEIRKALASFKLKENRLQECKEFSESLLQKQVVCMNDLEVLKQNYEQFKKNAQSYNVEQINKLKQELRQKEEKIHTSIVNEIHAEHQIMSKRASERFEEVSKAIDSQAYFEVALLQFQKDQELAESKIKQLQQQITLIKVRKEQTEQKKKQADEEKAKHDHIVKTAEQMILQRQEDINGSIAAYHTTEEALQRIQMLSGNVTETVQYKIQELTTTSQETWRKCLLETVDIICAYHKFIDSRIQRKARDVQHLAITYEEIKVQLQDANERENLVDVERFQKRKVKNEAHLKAAKEEQERLHKIQENCVQRLKPSLQELEKLKEDRHLQKVQTMLNKV